MLTFAVSLNGEHLCQAGFDKYGVLNVSALWALRDPTEVTKTWPTEQQAEGLAETLELSVGGMTVGGNENGTFPKWANVPLERGDQVTIRIVESDTCDPPDSVAPAMLRDAVQQKQKHCRQLAQELGWKITELE